ncbi:sigma 54-interacting transcriptional regulator [Rhizobium sullae]|uniref:Sigma 54-interacting transcriptional regulator n=1 Tax=Rhizobium sullae TaxID=50338 RepID=A0A4R3PRX7_RHISU|nr:sigma 54-interacting transcriptional regulator [Rhizobium sullae]TCU07601.1 transcriptional regulator with PAS, ATPase and Fis domain [Rhizobium sullae]UWU19132.1 sigma 54-interacting transcriptional regulator [Rhizobium sullae]
MKFYANDINAFAPRGLRPGFVDDPQFRGFLEALPDGAAFLEIDGTIKLANGKLELLLNLARADLVGSELAKHAKTAGPLIQKLAAALHQLKRIEVSGALNSQRNVFASLSILRNQEGGAYGALLTMREANRQHRPNEGSERFRFETETGEVARTAYHITPRLHGLARKGEMALERGSAILLTGETGTGKTEFAKRIGHSDKAGAVPFVHVNCGMLSDEQFDVEMFGIEPGSPLDQSTRGKLGFIEAADGGILFLDQVTDLSVTSQMKLVSFLETQTFSRVGSMQRRRARFRLITSTNLDLGNKIAEGVFRPDLFYRIAVVTIALPPLREQPDLVEAVADQMLRRINLIRKPQLRLSPEFTDLLQAHSYPGNLRELSNILEQAVACAEGVALPEHFMAPILAPARTEPKHMEVPAPSVPAHASLKDLVQGFETWILEKSIAENGSKRSAAKALGIDIATLVRKTKRK